MVLPRMETECVVTLPMTAASARELERDRASAGLSPLAVLGGGGSTRAAVARVRILISHLEPGCRAAGRPRLAGEGSRPALARGQPPGQRGADPRPARLSGWPLSCPIGHSTWCSATASGGGGGLVARPAFRQAAGPRGTGRPGQRGLGGGSGQRTVRRRGSPSRRSAPSMRRSAAPNRPGRRRTAVTPSAIWPAAPPRTSPKGCGSDTPGPPCAPTWWTSRCWCSPPPTRRG